MGGNGREMGAMGGLLIIFWSFGDLRERGRDTRSGKGQVRNVKEWKGMSVLLSYLEVLGRQRK